MTGQPQFDLSPSEDQNPLLIPIPKSMDFVDLAHWLRQECRPGPWKWEAVHDELRRVFVETEDSLQIAQSFLSILRQGLKHRDPRLPENKRLVADMGRFKLKGLSFDKLPARKAQAAAMVVSGITGVGKSKVIERICELIPRLHVHPENPEAGWLRQHQLVYLVVHMSADGTPGAFVEQAFLDLDAAAETSYCQRYLGQQISVARKMVAFMHALIVHSCGALIIEECQHENMIAGPFARLFQDYFLTMLNYGIPIVIIGNPAGVKWINQKAQNLRRAAAGGVFRLDPILNWKQDEWVHDWMPAIWDTTCLPAEDEVWMARGDLEKLVWQLTGGVPDFLCKLRAETLRAAITSGSPRVEREHFQTACRSPRFLPLMEVAFSLSSRDADSLSQDDMDKEYFRALWSHPDTIKLEVLDDLPSEVEEAQPEESASVDAQGGEAKTPRARAVKPAKQQPKSIKKPRAAKAKKGVTDLGQQDCRSEGWLARHTSSMNQDAAVTVSGTE